MLPLRACGAMVMETTRRRTHEKVIGIGVWTANLEQLHQVVELAMDIAAHSDGAFLPKVSREQVVLTRGETYHWLNV